MSKRKKAAGALAGFVGAMAGAVIGASAAEAETGEGDRKSKLKGPRAAGATVSAPLNPGQGKAVARARGQAPKPAEVFRQDVAPGMFEIGAAQAVSTSTPVYPSSSGSPILEGTGEAFELPLSLKADAPGAAASYGTESTTCVSPGMFSLEP